MTLRSSLHRMHNIRIMRNRILEPDSHSKTRDLTGIALTIVKELWCFCATTFAIVPHAADCESLFSILSYNHTDARNRLSPFTLKTIAQLKLNIRRDKSKIISHEQKLDDDVEDIYVAVSAGTAYERIEADFDQLGLGVSNNDEKNEKDLKDLYESQTAEYEDGYHRTFG